jgi:hypothetical protein
MSDRRPTRVISPISPQMVDALSQWHEHGAALSRRLFVQPAVIGFESRRHYNRETRRLKIL